jgi:UDP-N-acetylmuramate dehydrogenase
MINRLIDIVGDSNVYQNEDMCNHTTFKVGGPADLFVVPQDIEQVKQVVALCKENNENYYIIGKGSNLLVGDKGFRGIIVCLYNTLNDVDVEQVDDEFIVIAGAGIMLSKLANIILDNSLEGFEFASGIPGTLGGAVAMNAGAYGGEIKDCIVEATVLDDKCNIKTLGVDELDLSYRNSVILKKGYVVLEAKFRFRKGDKDSIKETMLDLNMRRKEKQPLEYPSAGSTFKRPEGYFAGKLIMDSGLAGFSVGGACVSEKHCGFVINKDSATASDIRELMNKVDEIVYDKYNVHLEPEVRIIGEF